MDKRALGGSILIATSIVMVLGSLVSAMAWITGQELQIELVSSADVTVQAGSTFDIELRFTDVGSVPGWNELARITIGDYYSQYDKDDTLAWEIVSSVTNGTRRDRDEVEPDFLPSGAQPFDTIVTIAVNTKSDGFLTDTSFPRQGIARVFVNYGYITSYETYINITLTASPVSYFLVTSVSPLLSGTVSPESGTYASGALLLMNATPNERYEFSHWAGDLSGSSTPRQLWMDSNKNVVAHFEGGSPPPTYELTTEVLPVGGGVVSPDGGVFTEGTAITLLARPADGYGFKYWSGDASGSSLSTIITMDTNKSVIANFYLLEEEPSDPLSAQMIVASIGAILAVPGAVLIVKRKR